jgi:hypothetical protein
VLDFMKRIKRDTARLTKVSVNLPFGIGGAEWTPDNAERDAAWKLYVELMTRIAVEELAEDEGLLREALSSLHDIFPETRHILKDAGPEVGARMPSIGGIAIRVLNRGLRPFLTKWHPMLSAWEATRKPHVSSLDHERGWTDAKELRAELGKMRKSLASYAHALGKACGVED